MEPWRFKVQVVDNGTGKLYTDGVGHGSTSVRRYVVACASRFQGGMGWTGEWVDGMGLMGIELCRAPWRTNSFLLNGWSTWGCTVVACSRR